MKTALQNATETCLAEIERTFSNGRPTNNETLNALVIDLYDILSDALAEDVDWWERDEQAEQEKRNRMFINN